MLVNFGLKNYFSFKEGADVTFLLEKKASDSLPNHKGISYVIGIKGANGSGKTNIIRSMGFISDFITNSYNYKKNEVIEIDSFLMNDDNSEFYFDFYSGKYLYSYYISLNEEKVSEEILTRKIQRETTVFHRVGNSINECLKEIDEIKKIKLKKNSSLLSILNNFEFESEMKPLHDAFYFFKGIISNVDYVGLQEAPINHGYHDLCSAYKNAGRKSLEFATKIIKLADNSIEKIDISEVIDDETGKVRYLPLFKHKRDNKTESIFIYDESSGTKYLFRTMGLYWQVLNAGGVMCIDEFDLHLHSMILPHIIELFENEKINKHKAQFIFTAHNTEIMDYLGKYRTILVNKKNLESYCYRLDEIPSEFIPNSSLRSDRKISSAYLKGKLGGVPEL